MKLGLSRFQAILYTTSVKHGMLSVLELSRLTKINRQQLYEEARGLVEMGLYEVTRKHRRKYIPASPSKLARISKSRISEAEAISGELVSMIPALEAMSLPQKNKVNVRYYEGIAQIKTAFDDQLDVMKNTEGVSFSGSLEEVYSHIPESYWAEWDAQFIKQNSFYRMLAHNTDAGRRTAEFDRQFKRETRWIEEFPLRVNIEVFNDVVLIVSFGDEMAIWIESKILADAQRMVFKSLWDRSKSFD